VAKYYQSAQRIADALAYLAKRGIDNAEAIEHFKIGFSDRTLGLAMPTNRTNAGKDMRSRMEKLPASIKETGHETDAAAASRSRSSPKAVSVKSTGRRIDNGGSRN